MPVVAVVAVVVGAFVADDSVGTQPGLGPVLDEAGVLLAGGADDGGTSVALFF
jgi:hypothetical protein